MPPRSNIFQRVIRIVEKHLAPGVTITESKMLTDLVSGAEREVDIVLEGGVGSNSVIVGIECRDHNRPGTVQWVQEMKAKHERLPTNPLVLISRSGFTKEAQRVSASYGIKTLSLEGAVEDDAGQIFGSTSALWGKSFTLHATKIVMRVSEETDLPAVDVVVEQDYALYSPDGAVLGPVKTLVEKFLRSEEIGKKLWADAKDEHTHFEIHLDDLKHRGHPYFLMERESDRLRPVEYIRITGTLSISLSEFPLIRGSLEGINVAWAAGELFQKGAIVIASRDKSGNSKVSINFSGNVKEKNQPKSTT